MFKRNIPAQPRLPLLLLSLLVAGAFFVGTAAAKPAFAGKPDFAGKEANKAEKGDRGRSDKALEHAKSQGKGKKKGIGNRDKKGKERG
jgi:hypothetical protein